MYGQNIHYNQISMYTGKHITSKAVSPMRSGAASAKVTKANTGSANPQRGDLTSLHPNLRSAYQASNPGQQPSTASSAGQSLIHHHQHQAHQQQQSSLVVLTPQVHPLTLPPLNNGGGMQSSNMSDYSLAHGKGMGQSSVSICKIDSLNSQQTTLL